ncbi:MAG: helix-turn-helix transcriptional regulator [Methanobrevibacter sp.]|uniref:winged helix-turn-helix transcriptional regulator n=1 Tax=Methanobrevibacter sp. TaxID=66852 RepID=UPI001B7CCEDD|nr:helix-turn-helix domain-containing protein [Methanobrevibacter sp.]MBP3791844.1 helix-turn-helix transcriptional regulator [Methanobrevibacter sp.]
MVTDDNASVCPIELAMQMISRKWVIQILRDMFFGKTRFNEFKEDKPGLSNKVLSHCLKDMEENRLIKRHELEDSIEYKLTERGLALNKVLYELAMFTLTSDLGEEYYSDEYVDELKVVFRGALLKEDS